MKILLIIVTALVGILIIVEGSLRIIVGLGNPPLYLADEEIGYLLAPNQQVRRRGNRIEINQYSMRSKAIAPKKPISTWRIMLLGDSIVNGGWWTDRNETISALIEGQLTSYSAAHSVEVLNASANSWGPRNQLAYLRRFGLFDADAIVLIINTDDLFATAPTSLPVGRDRNYPDRKPILALVELYTHLLGKDKPMKGIETIQKEKGDRVGSNLQAIREIKKLALDANAQFVLAMTPLLREVSEMGSRDYESKARNRLQEFATTEQIFYLDFLPIFRDFPQPEFLYRDHIHLSPSGNRLVSDSLSQLLQQKLQLALTDD
ncbi:SGNH/GDSL hydrolase family protein [Pleurocapsales cyanobacterium LEGE 06147]|nr:SGNH/GDSL hydrolase family protein [Pleurocapsales cyanobacterium LEGE 06147]